MGSGQLWIVGGPNGAGKSTIVQREPMNRFLARVRFLNPDDRTLEKLRERGFKGFADAPADILRELFVDSANEVENELRTMAAHDAKLGVESVLSTLKYVGLVEEVIRRGGRFLVYVALETPSLSGERVATRVRGGGHDVPADRLAARWQRSLDNLAGFARLATKFWILDNSSGAPDVPMKLVAEGHDGRIVDRNETFPELAKVLDDLEAGT